MVIHETPQFSTFTLNAQGSIRTTFLDKDMRIARGAAPNGLYSETDSNVFVLWRA